MKIIPARFLLFLFVFLTVLAVPGCTTSPAPTALPETSNPAASAGVVKPTQMVDFTEIKASRAWRIAFIPKFKLLGATGKLSSYWQPAWDGAQKAGTDFGVQVRLVTANTQGSADTDYVEPQIRLVADLIEQGEIDGLVVAPFDSNRLAPVIEKAIAAGIPVVAMDTPVNSDQLLTFVTFDNFAAGEALGKWSVQKMGGKGNALILDGPQDQQNAIDRRNGFFAGLKTGEVEILNTKSADWEIEPAHQITAEWLAKYPNVNVILAANDNMALGAARAVAEAGRTGILITGFDATDPALQAIQAGQISATVDQSPGGQARLAIQLLIRHLENGATFPPIIFLPKIPLISQENVGTFLASRGLK